MFPCARFDDLTPGREHAFALRGLVDTIVARRVSEVVPAVEAVNRAVAGGRWAGGFIAYEAAEAFDGSLRVLPRGDTDPFSHLPLVWFGIFDRREEYPVLEPRSAGPLPYHVSSWRPSVTRDEYEDAVRSILEFIRAGDTYQVNYTFRLRAAVSGDVNELYRDLIHSQHGAYCAYLDLGRYRVLSASPELFFRWEGSRIETKPMKGTERRGRWPEEDDELAARLRASEKDRAENLMIVDLLRNDLGRIAEFGTVRVEELLSLERYATVWQLTSSIAAEVRPEVTFLDTLRALFPSGSITGAPKPRTMEIIADLETVPRGVYCGAIGYLAPEDATGPRACFNVAIRTAVFDQEEGVAEYGVGGGITWDSRSASEYEEALLKAEVLTARRPDADLLETMRYEPGVGFFYLEEHLDRMQASAAHLGYQFDPATVRAAVETAVGEATRSLVVRVTLARNGEAVVHTSPAFGEFRMEDHPIEDVPARVALDEVPVDSTNPYLFHKTTWRGIYDKALERHPDVDDVIMVNERGEVTESTIANVVVRFGDEWWTPRLDSGCLPGVYRQVLIDKGILRERYIAASELSGATGLGLINSVRGWRSAVIVHAPEHTSSGEVHLG